MNVKAQVALLSALSTLGLTACGGGSKDSPAPAHTQSPTVSANGLNTPNISVSAAQDAAGRGTFPKTLASGNQKWGVSNVMVTYQLQEKGVKRAWTSEDCEASAPLLVNGTYPNVTLSMPAFDCGDRGVHELALLGSITRSLSYRAVPAPAAGEPDQFRLYLAGSNAGSVLRWQSQQSLNGLAKDQVLYLDFVGNEQPDPGYPQNRRHFVQVTLSPGDDKSSEKLSVEYVYDADALPEHVDVTITADLDRN